MPRRCALILLLAPSIAAAQETVALRETFAPGYHYHVSCRVRINGELTLPDKALKVEGNSRVEYDERILVEKNQRVEKTIRQFRGLDFERKVGDNAQKSSLRPAVSRMVLLRHENFEIPFSDGGPLKLNEIELVRTDVFTPALAGLFPAEAVTRGKTWNAQSEAIRELTDLEKIDQGSLVCRFEGVEAVVGRPQARVSFKGAVQGVGEDGPARHDIDGFVYFDLTGRYLSYVSLKGTHYLLDNKGVPKGKVEGTFVLTRQPTQPIPELSDNAIRNLSQEPTPQNTMLLFDDEEMRLKFLYPRRWRVSRIDGMQMTLEEKGGNGLLITCDVSSKLPTGAQYQQETKEWLTRKKAEVSTITPPNRVDDSPSLEHFQVEAKVDGQPVVLDYHVTRGRVGGATLAARFTPRDAKELQGDARLIARTLQMGE
ncbi:MAG: hypothetical protein K2X38_15605 [Gemmataceae bacterium]|nr:hypothetical protein [Gemmataceae bacterium]